MSTARIFVFATFALAGCAETCPPPQAALDGKSWEVFGRLMTPLDQDPPPDWPAATHPFNGPHTWTITWADSALDSPVTVTIDDQPFEGKGVFNEIECGNFSVGFQGTYTGDDGSQHQFGATTRLIVFDETLDGFVDFQGSWLTTDDDQGTAAGSAQLSAVLGDATSAAESRSSGRPSAVLE